MERSCRLGLTTVIVIVQREEVFSHKCWLLGDGNVAVHEDWVKLQVFMNSHHQMICSFIAQMMHFVVVLFEWYFFDHEVCACTVWCAGLVRVVTCHFIVVMHFSRSE